ncbi:hypothetical protein [Geomicrobium sp. JCM 19037]|uniref:hypothetical protein n=1 Tax=Geomicrobium sp. JCM 19037 TaxID=1460634 RepID=UPI0005AA277B|nr:hypothetical protein [Geomicrobium sp. JCM 19037]
MLTVEVKGLVQGEYKKKGYYLQTFSDYRTTSLVIAALVKIMLTKRVKGVATPYDITEIDEILSIINNDNIRLKNGSTAVKLQE